MRKVIAPLRQTSTNSVASLGHVKLTIEKDQQNRIADCVDIKNKCTTRPRMVVSQENHEKSDDYIIKKLKYQLYSFTTSSFSFSKNSVKLPTIPSKVCHLPLI